MWQSDFIHWRLADGTDVEVLNWLDDHSRYLLSCTVHEPLTGDDVVSVFRRRHRGGRPAGEAPSRTTAASRSPASPAVARVEYILRSSASREERHPGDPQTQGKTERFDADGDVAQGLAANGAQRRRAAGRSWDEFVRITTSGASIEPCNRRTPDRRLPRQPRKAFSASNGDQPVITASLRPAADEGHDPPPRRTDAPPRHRHRPHAPNRAPRRRSTTTSPCRADYRRSPLHPPDRNPTRSQLAHRMRYRLMAELSKVRPMSRTQADLMSRLITEGERGDSNPRPPGPQPGALPAELRPPRRLWNLAAVRRSR